MQLKSNTDIERGYPVGNTCKFTTVSSEPQHGGAISRCVPTARFQVTENKASCRLLYQHSLVAQNKGEGLLDPRQLLLSLLLFIHELGCHPLDVSKSRRDLSPPLRVVRESAGAGLQLGKLLLGGRESVPRGPESGLQDLDCVIVLGHHYLQGGLLFRALDQLLFLLFLLFLVVVA